MKLLIMKFSPLPRHLVPLRPKYSQHPILKHSAYVPPSMAETACNIILSKYGSLWAVQFVNFTHQIWSRLLRCEGRQDEPQCTEIWPCAVTHVFCIAYSFRFLQFLRHLNRTKQSAKCMTRQVTRVTYQWRTQEFFE
jgi:hypothetical protein